MTVSFRHKHKHKIGSVSFTIFVDGVEDQGRNARDDAVRRGMNWDGLGLCFFLEPGVVLEIPRWEAIRGALQALGSQCLLHSPGLQPDPLQDPHRP